MWLEVEVEGGGRQAGGSCWETTPMDLVVLTDDLNTLIKFH